VKRSYQADHYNDPGYPPLWHLMVFVHTVGLDNEYAWTHPDIMKAIERIKTSLREEERCLQLYKLRLLAKQLR